MKSLSFYFCIAMLAVCLTTPSAHASSAPVAYSSSDIKAWGNSSIDDKTTPAFTQFLRDHFLMTDPVFKNTKKDCSQFTGAWNKTSFPTLVKRGLVGLGSHCRQSSCFAFCRDKPDSGTFREAICLNFCIKAVSMGEDANLHMKNAYRTNAHLKDSDLIKHWENYTRVYQVPLTVDNDSQAEASLTLIESNLENVRGNVDRLSTLLAKVNVRYIAMKEQLTKVGQEKDKLEKAVQTFNTQYKAYMEFIEEDNKKNPNRKLFFDFNAIEAAAKNKASSIQSKLRNASLFLKLSEKTNMPSLKSALIRKKKDPMKEFDEVYKHALKAFEEVAVPYKPKPTINLEELERELLATPTKGQDKPSLIITKYPNSSLKESLVKILQESEDEKLSVAAAAVLAELNTIPIPAQ